MLKKSGVILFRVFSLMVGLLFLFCAYVFFDEYHKSKYWPEVIGTVVTSEMTKNRKGLYCPKVIIEYNTKAIKQLAKLKFSHTPCKPEFMTVNLTKKFQVGSERMVYYDPEFLDSVILERGKLSWIFFLFLFGSLPFLTITFIPANKSLKHGTPPVGGAP